MLDGVASLSYVGLVLPHCIFLSAEIGDYVGHSSTFMVNRYRHLREGAEKEASTKLDAYLEKSSSRISSLT